MALNFREQLQKDEATFFNCSELATERLIDDQRIPVIICNNELKERRVKEADGTYTEELILLVQKNYFKKKPEEGQKIRINNEQYYVLECGVQMTTYKMTVDKNRSW